MPIGLGTAIYIKRIDLCADEKTVENVKELAWRAKLSMSAYLRDMVEKQYLQLENNQKNCNDRWPLLATMSAT